MLRYQSSKNLKDYISLDDYFSNNNNNNIYYLIGKNVKELTQSPLIEKYIFNNKNILFMTDTLDEYIMSNLKEYNGKTLVSLSRDNNESNNNGKYNLFFEKIKIILENKIEYVKLSYRLVESPSCLISSELGWSANMERITNAGTFNDKNLNDHMKSKKILEINMDHKINKELYRRFILNSQDISVIDLIHLIYDLSLIRSGYSIDNLKDFSNRYVKMIELGLRIDDANDEVEYL